MRRRDVWTAAVGLFLLGCAPKLNHEVEYLLDFGDIKSVEIDPVKKSQTVKVAVSATEPAVNVYVVADKDRAAVESKLSEGGKTDKLPVITKKEGIKEETVTASVPSGTKAFVFVTATKKCNAKVKITN